MKVDVRGAGYTEGSALLHSGNVRAAQHYGRLSEKLAGTAAMAGDSSFADRWAAEYDAAAEATLASFADAVQALGNLGRLASTSWENHTRAELASTFGDTRLLDDVAFGTHDWGEVVRTAPPSVLGGDPSSLPGWANMILDHVEGFVWPDADLDRLRATATAWRMAGQGLDEVTTFPQRAATALWSECSPEILPATAAIGRLAQAIGDLGDQCRDLGGLCEGYANAVEEQRQAILDLVTEMLVEAAAIQAAGFVLGLVTFGTANGGAVAVNLAKIAVAAPRFKRMLEIVRIYADEAAEALAGTRLAVAGVGARVKPMSDTRLLMTAEVGQVGSKVKPLTSMKSFLARHEGGPFKAHTIEKHVGKSDEYLRHRIQNGKKLASTFTDEGAGEASARRVLSMNARQIEEWLAKPTQHGLALNGDMPNTVGRVMDSAGHVTDASRVKMVLVQDRSMPDGYRILTSHPTP